MSGRGGGFFDDDDKPAVSSPQQAGGRQSFLSRLRSPSPDRAPARDADGDIDIDDLIGGDGAAEETHLQRLMRAWINERGAPMLLIWEGDLVDEVMGQLEDQVRMVDLLRGDERSEEEEHFQLMLVQTEMERVKFVLRSYIRVRLFKIEQYAQHIVTTPELHSLLSGIELAHAQKYQTLVEAHHRVSVLNSLPPTMGGLDDVHGGHRMIPQPDLDTAVFIRARKHCGDLSLPNQSITLSKNSIFLVRFQDIAKLLMDDSIELI